MKVKETRKTNRNGGK